MGDKMFIEETPGCLWLFGLFFAVIGGIFVYGSLGGFTNRDEVPAYAIYLAFFMGAVGVAVGTWIISRAPVTKVTVDREKQTVTHLRLGLFGKRQKIYAFDHLKGFIVIEEKDDEGDPIWSLGMELSNGELVTISSLPRHDEQFKRNFVFRANQFMYKQMPSYKPVSEIGG